MKGVQCRDDAFLVEIGHDLSSTLGETISIHHRGGVDFTSELW
jgi:hypothetical protein